MSEVEGVKWREIYGRVEPSACSRSWLLSVISWRFAQTLIIFEIAFIYLCMPVEVDGGII